MSVRKREKLLSKIIVSVLAASSLYGLGIGNVNAYAEDLDGTNTGGKAEVKGEEYDTVYGVYTYDGTGIANAGNVIMTGGKVEIVYGGWSYNNNNNNRDNSEANYNIVTISGGTVGFVHGGGSNNSIGNSKANHNEVTINGGTVDYSVYGGYSTAKDNSEANYNRVTISGEGTIVIGSVYGGRSAGGSTSKANYNTVTINGGTVNSNIYGGYTQREVTHNKVIISGGIISNNVYGGYIGSSSSSAKAEDNTIILTGTSDSTFNISAANLYGSNKSATGTNNNNLDIDSFTGEVNSLNNFNNINLNNIQWQNGGTVLEVLNNKQTSDLSDTNIYVNSLNLQGGSTIKENETMQLIHGTGLNINNKKVFGENFTAGVTAVGRGISIVNNEGLSYTISSIALNPQTKLIAENRAVAAAFINQGSDLISSGLDSLHDQYGYGFKTFAAVYGNRSTYDAGGDLKINGWSEIIGLGSSKEFADGDLDWGVFYENGSGNYRTYNQFNDEFFRGDGSMVYNGGGIAARFTKNNGWYYEGSLRAGTLKSEIDHALKDGNGNMYGYKSDTTYYGAHLGLGKILPLSDSQDLNVYGKYFHTYNDGDEFTIAGDKFSFDSVTSDRIILGAKITTNKNNAWKTHYGLAWEYEFNGDSDMRAGQFDVPTQSLKGSTFIGEIGFSYQDKSPWSFDISLKGYQGERDGFSGHAQATYNF